MNSQIKVSVVVPVYNVQVYLKQCIESILAQSLQEIEVICVNDGSTDNSLKILKEFESDSHKVFVINQNNQGAGPARNHGIDIAHGKYIAFIDPDDYYDSNRALETLYLFAEQNNARICCGNMKNTANEYIRKRFTKNENKVFTDLKNCGAHFCNIYNLEFLRRNKIYYPDYRRFQDPPFLTKAMITAKEFFAVNIDVYVYRMNHKKLYYSEDVLINVISGINDILNIVKENNFSIEFPIQVLEENRNSILRHSIDRTQKVEDALKELNKTISKVLGERFIITQNEITKYQEVCENIYEAIKNKEPIVVYGAGEVGKKAVQMMDSMDGNIVGIAVSDMKKNPRLLGRHAVNPIKYYSSSCDQTVVMLSVGQAYQREILENICSYGFKNIYICDIWKMDYIERVLMRKEAL